MTKLKVNLTEQYSSEDGSTTGYYLACWGMKVMSSDLKEIAKRVLQTVFTKKIKDLEYVFVLKEGAHPVKLCDEDKCPLGLEKDVHKIYTGIPGKETIDRLKQYLSDPQLISEVRGWMDNTLEIIVANR